MIVWKLFNKTIVITESMKVVGKVERLGCFIYILHVKTEGRRDDMSELGECTSGSEEAEDGDHLFNFIINLILTKRSAPNSKCKNGREF